MLNKTQPFIEIPNPCHEDWNAISATEKGRYCSSCKQEVVDYSELTKVQLINQISSKKTECGRFRLDQLKSNLVTQRKSNSWIKYALSMMIGLGASSIHGQSIETYQTEINKSQREFISIKLPEDNSKSKILVTGMVTDKSGEALIGVEISIKESVEKTTTNIDGKFTIRIIPGSTLVIRYLGFNTDSIKVDAKTTNITVQLDEAIIDCFPVYVTGLYVKHQPTWKEKIKSKLGTIAKKIGESLNSNTNRPDIFIDTVKGIPIPKEPSITPRIHPNPVSNQLTVQHDFYENATFQILSMKNQLIMHGKINSKKTLVDINHLKSGSYLFSMSTKNELLFSQVFIKI